MISFIRMLLPPRKVMLLNSEWSKFVPNDGSNVLVSVELAQCWKSPGNIDSPVPAKGAGLRIESLSEQSFPKLASEGPVSTVVDIRDHKSQPIYPTQILGSAGA